MPIANKEFLVGAFAGLGDNRREALKIAAGLRGEDAMAAGVAEEPALATVLPWLSEERATERLGECIELPAGTGPGPRTSPRRSGAPQDVVAADAAAALAVPAEDSRVE